MVNVIVRPNSSADIALPIAVVGLVVGLLFSFLLVFFGLANSRDPNLSCQTSRSTDASELLRLYPEAAQVNSGFGTWPIGITCTYRAPSGGATITVPPTWDITVGVFLGLATSTTSLFAIIVLLLHRTHRTN